MASTSQTDRTLYIAAALLVAVFLINLFLGELTGLITFQALRPFTVLAIFITIFAAFRHGLARRATEERRDRALERDERTDDALFEKDEIEPFTIRRTHFQLERFVVAPFTLIVGLLASLRAMHFFGVLQKAEAPGGADLLLVLSFLFSEAFLLFLFSRYLIGLARSKEEKYARGAGIAIGLVCLGAVVGAIGALAGHLMHPYADVVAAYVLTAVLLLISIEYLLTLLVAIYSPRRAELISTSYHSRIGGMMTDPAGWVKSFTHALDYQFGFSISQTWFYVMLRRTIGPLLLAIGAVVYLMSCFVFLQPEEAGVLERFGKPVEGKWHLESGFHLKWPWPIERVRRLAANRLLTANVGYEPNPDEERLPYILWTRPHYLQEKTFVVASRSSAGEETVGSAFGFLTVNMPIKYTISNLRHYLYNFRDPDTMVLRIGEKVLVQALSKRELSDVLGAGRGELSSSMKGDMQREADALSLGVTFKFVGLQGIHPPTEVAASFQEVVGALQEKESAILAARSFKAAAIPNAEALAREIVLQAESDRTNRIEIASATAERFALQRSAHQAAPAVYKSEAYMKVIRDRLNRARLYVIDRPDHEIFQFEFDEKILPDIFELDDTVNDRGDP